MEKRLRSGQKGEPLPKEEGVFRLVKASKDGKASEGHFALTQVDKESDPPALSVWAETLTTPEQAREFRLNKQGIWLVLSLFVELIRSLRPEDDSPDLPNLDVVWDPLTIQEADTIILDPRPGAEGHSAIVNLRLPGMTKSQYKSLRSQLADNANVSVLPDV